MDKGRQENGDPGPFGKAETGTKAYRAASDHRDQRSVTRLLRGTRSKVILSFENGTWATKEGFLWQNMRHSST